MFGWITTWLYFLFDPVAVASVCGFTGLLVQYTVSSQYHVHISWYIWFFIFLAVVTLFTLFGIALSVKAMLLLGGLEVGVFLALGLSGMVSPGPGGFKPAEVERWLKENLGAATGPRSPAPD